MPPKLGHSELTGGQRHGDQLDHHVLRLATPRNCLLGPQPLPVPFGSQQAIRRDSLSGRALPRDRRVEIALGAVGLTTPGSADPPRPRVRRNIGRQFVTAEFGDNCPLVSHLDLEPDPVVQREDPLGTAGIPLPQGSGRTWSA